MKEKKDITYSFKMLTLCLWLLSYHLFFRDSHLSRIRCFTHFFPKIFVLFVPIKAIPTKHILFLSSRIDSYSEKRYHSGVLSRESSWIISLHVTFLVEQWSYPIQGLWTFFRMLFDCYKLISDRSLFRNIEWQNWQLSPIISIRKSIQERIKKPLNWQTI